MTIVVLGKKIGNHPAAPASAPIPSHGNTIVEFASQDNQDDDDNDEL